jgi:hypothetical protein
VIFSHIEKLKRWLHVAEGTAKQAVDQLMEIEQRERFGVVPRDRQKAFAAAEAKKQIEAKLDQAIEGARKSGRFGDIRKFVD